MKLLPFILPILNIFHYQHCLIMSDIQDLRVRDLACALQSSNFKGEILSAKDGEAFSSLNTPWGSAHSKGLSLAIRSGGLMKSQTKGVSLKLKHLDAYSISSDKSQVTLGPGQTWQTVYEKMRDEKFTVLGGRVSFVGVGGYVGGGGLSYLVGQHGLASDSIIDAEVVLADGRIVHAASDPELLFGLKGAASNFGVITSVTLKTFPKPPVAWSGRLIFPAERFVEIAGAIHNYTSTNEDGRAGILFGSLAPPPDFQPITLVVPVWFGSAAQGEEHFDWLLKLGPLVNQMMEMSYEDLGKLQDSGATPAGVLAAWQTSVVPKVSDEKTAAAAFEWQGELVAKDARFGGTVLLFEPFVKNVFANVDDSTVAWPHKGEHMTVIGLMVLSPDPTLTGVPEALRDGVSRIAAAAPAGVHPQYPNYAFLHGEKAEDYYGANVHKLRLIKKRLDPANFFKGTVPLA
ncbi:hypothetical protein CBOM_05732 [Ceraceosorus bombacis]|uniref:FAD-binding PCMH-type domain-containing protein n=1 Tax=Ceraceosorus bombacis TaxID=401625 RepID=A0A0N7LBD1_9BASI|nr:hypothetical protein CBOM_05732 [Ceraceosorus bombacis]